MEYRRIVDKDNYQFLSKCVWDDSKPMIAYIGLNPTNASETGKHSRTSRRMKQFAVDQGYGGFYGLNVYPFRHKYPKELLRMNIPAVKTERNNYFINKMKETDIMIVAIWGNDGPILKDDFYHIGPLSKKGKPKHPLYLSKNLKFIK